MQLPLLHADRLYIGGEWVVPSSDATIEVTDSASEEVFLRVAEAMEPDIARAAGAARMAFDDGPWLRLSHAQQPQYLRAIAESLRERAEALGRVWPHESGVLHKIATRVRPAPQASSATTQAGRARSRSRSRQRRRGVASSG